MTAQEKEHFKQQEQSQARLSYAESQKMPNEIEPLLLVETSLGNITIKLYNETPKHRDNFLKLVQEDHYKDLLFHRVIKDFMIQGGDPSSRIASDSVMLGSGDLGYTIDAEFRMPQLFHKRGALAAARMGDNMNPGKNSSASQFYIVVGKLFTEEDLQKMEKKRLESLKQEILKDLQGANSDMIKEYYKNDDKEGLLEYREELASLADEEAYMREGEVMFTAEQREAYMTVGGTPHLDGAYTVFGEVVDGFDVMEKIQSVQTNPQSRPLENIKMNITIISE